MVTLTGKVLEEVQQMGQGFQSLLVPAACCMLTLFAKQKRSTQEMSKSLLNFIDMNCKNLALDAIS